MPRSKSEFDELIRLIGFTKDGEIICEQYLAVLSEFSERALAGRSIPEGLKAVEYHLAICGECQEEYEALRRAL